MYSRQTVEAGGIPYEELAYSPEELESFRL